LKGAPLLTILDRYILRQIAVPLLASLVIGLLMLLAERLIRIMEITLGKKNSFGVVFELMTYLMPHYLGTAVPAALFLGLLFAFNKLSKASEIDAMMATGTGLHRLARPVMFLAVLFCLASLVIFGWLQPLTRYAYRSVMFDVASVDAFYLAEEGVFMQSGTRTFILDKLDRKTNSFQKIFIFDAKKTGAVETLTAKEGALVAVAGQLRPVLHLVDGHRLSHLQWPDPSSQSTAGTAEFAVSDTPLGGVVKKAFRPRGDDERELTIIELYTKMNAPPPGSTPGAMRAELHRRMVNILAMLILPFLAIPFAVGRVRSPSAYRIAAALILLVVFHEIVEQGAVAAKAGNLSPWLTVWSPLAVLTIIAGWNFYRHSFRIAGEGFDSWLADMHDAIKKPFVSLFRRVMPKAAE
jgi:lipopolysaccharide export system permease protein